MIAEGTSDQKLSDATLPVFSAHCMETERMLKFQDWLRSNPDDKMRYQAQTVELANKVWKYTQKYAMVQVSRPRQNFRVHKISTQSALEYYLISLKMRII